MDVLEILSSIRNALNLHSESELSTRELLRYINQAYTKEIIPSLFDHIRADLYTESDLDDQTGETVTRPTLADKIIAVDRGGYPCIFVPLRKKHKIDHYYGRIKQYPDDDTKHPLYLEEGSNIRIYPTLDDTDVIISYRKKLPELVYGKGTVASTTALTLDTFVSIIDDIYNNHQIVLYSTSGTTITPAGIYTISDYVGSTRVATLSSAASNGTYEYALVPIVPDVFHPLVIDATFIELAKAGKYERNITTMKGELEYDIQKTQNSYVRD